MRLRLPVLVATLLLVLTISTAAAADGNGTADLTGAEAERGAEVKDLLQEAYGGHQVAETHVASAYRAGADTTRLDRRLVALEDDLTEALDALESKEFDRAETLARDVIDSSEEIRRTADEKGGEALVTHRLSTLRSKVDAPLAKRYLRQATDAWDRGDAATAREKMALAEQAQRVATHRDYVRNHSTGYGALEPLETELAGVERDLENGATAERRVDALSSDVTAAARAIERLERAEAAVQRAEIRSGLIVETNTSGVEDTIDAAKQRLADGNYGEAASLAARAARDAEAEAERVEKEAEDNPLAGVLSTILGIFSSPTAAEVSVPQPESVDLGRVDAEYRPPTTARVKQLRFDGLSGELPTKGYAQSGTVVRKAPQPTATPRPTATATQQPHVAFFLDTEEPAPCGTTCRKVTATLRNTGTLDAHDVEVTTTITTGGEQIWEETETVGTLAPGDSHTVTKKVDIGYWNAMKIKNNGGTIEIKTVISSDEKRVELSETRKVA